LFRYIQILIFKLDALGWYTYKRYLVKIHTKICGTETLVITRLNQGRQISTARINVSFPPHRHHHHHHNHHHPPPC